MLKGVALLLLVALVAALLGLTPLAGAALFLFLMLLSVVLFSTRAV